MNVAIPDWNAQAVIPPVAGSSGVSASRSPYPVSLIGLMSRFGSSPERRAILDGFLRYRAALHAAGLRRGFQWIDGSFLEDVERSEGRAPNDLDLVTFFHRPDGVTQRELVARRPGLFVIDPESARVLKTEFRVDAYAIDLAMEAQRLVGQSAYWYSMWSHRRDQRWKGFLQLDLAPTDDGAARAILAAGGSS